MSMPKGDVYVVMFATIVCVVCSLMLAAAASSLKTKQDYNVEIDRKMNVLKAFGVNSIKEDGKKLTGPDVEQIFKDHISEVIIDGATGQVLEGLTSEDVNSKELAAKTKLPLYVWKDGEEVTKYAFPISGKGLWSTVYGYLALDKDLATIVGATFYKHGETPGLGGECSSEWFQAQFRGKKVYDNGQRLRFEVVKGSVEDKYPEGNDHAVDGMSGATITGNGITRFMNADIDKYEKYFKLIRKG